MSTALHHCKDISSYAWHRTSSKAIHLWKSSSSKPVLTPQEIPTQPPLLGHLSLLNSDLDWAYTTAPQTNIQNWVHTVHAGKALGGGSAINLGSWARGNASDYDNPKQHGFDGLIRVTLVSASDPQRRYPLRDPGRQPGSVSFWRIGIGQRQPAHLAYGLDGVNVITGAKVHRVIFKDVDGHQVASSVLLSDGQFTARKEIILFAGEVKTPQILKIAGMGPADVLSKHSIPVISENPERGYRMLDHFSLFTRSSNCRIQRRDSLWEVRFIDSNFYSTNMDHISLIYATHRVLQALLGTAAGKEYFENKVPPPGLPALTPQSTDEEIDACIRAVGKAR
ncbi:hypothetical protein VTN00DRAFT_2434 [Thermoascus crustaceus]|uniref:uncharacterized protein n=1 Tax=Thermoascus crustaceus TaxID=5088 RepID=UPI003743D4E8